MDRKYFMTLNPSDIVKWCRDRKKSLGLSNQKLSDISGVPIGTIDRIMSGNYTEFKYSSIQPIVSTLLGQNEETPEPKKNNDEQAKYYYDTIEGYKLVVDNKNREIEVLKKELEVALIAKEYLKKENECKEQHIKWFETILDDIKIQKQFTIKKTKD